MPLVRSCTVAAFRSNVASEIRAGKPREQAVAIAADTLRSVCEKEGKPVPIGKSDHKPKKKRERTREFLEEALKRARAALNPRDFAVIFQAARASAGGQVAARLRRERNYVTAAEKAFIEKASLRDMSKAELREIERALDNAYGKNLKSGHSNDRVLSRARSLFEEMKRRDMDTSGRVYVALRGAKERAGKAAHLRLCPPGKVRDPETGECVDVDKVSKVRKPIHTKVLTALRNGTLTKPKKCSKCGSATKSSDLMSHHVDYRSPLDVLWLCRPCHGSIHATAKGFVNGDPEGGMHAHGLDRRNSKTLVDGQHLHIWMLPGTKEIIFSREDGEHAHAVAESGDATENDGIHSHRVLLPNGALIETKLAGAHPHQLMVETSGFDGLHKHMLVMPDGTELDSLSPGEFVATLDELPPKVMPSPPASAITSALNELRMESETADAFAPQFPELAEAVDMCVNGDMVDPPTFALEVEDPSDYEMDVEIGDILEVGCDGVAIGFSKHVISDDPADVSEALTKYGKIEKHTTKVEFTGPKDARLMFVGTAPNELELARKRAIVGDDAIIFEDLYLSPLGLNRNDVAVGFAMPVLPHDELNVALCEKWQGHLVDAMRTYKSAKVVALGKVAREVLTAAGIEHWSLPHPSAVRKSGHMKEIDRKLRRISKALDADGAGVQDRGQRKEPSSKDGDPANLADAISEMRKTGYARCRVIKSLEEKQIVYGVVLDPYEVDLQTEWVPPSETESTAHGFLKKSRVIGFEHMKPANAQIVESWVEPYPSRQDYEAAMENRPHRAFTRKFGDDVIHSGTWMAGVQLGDKEWAMHKRGELDAFSVGGFSFKASVTTAAMPEVEFVELIEAT